MCCEIKFPDVETKSHNSNMLFILLDLDVGVEGIAETVFSHWYQLFDINFFGAITLKILSTKALQGVEYFSLLCC